MIYILVVNRPDLVPNFKLLAVTSADVVPVSKLLAPYILNLVPVASYSSILFSRIDRNTFSRNCKESI